MGAENIIDALKVRLSAETDSDLARKLAVDKRTISSWRSRNKVPDRYQAILEGSEKQAVLTAPLKWGEYEQTAFKLALYRFARARSEVAQSSDYATVFRAFEAERGFWSLMLQAQLDLAKVLDNGSSVSLHTALAIVIHEDIKAGSDAISRDRLKLD